MDKNLVLTPRYTKRFIKTLEKELVLNAPMLKVHVDDFTISWFKRTTHKQYWTLTRAEAFRLRLFLGRQMEKKTKSPLTVTRELIRYLPAVYPITGE